MNRSARPGERARAVVLYGTALAVLIAGGAWWLRAAPHYVPNPRIARWHAAAEAVLPDGMGVNAAATVDLAAGSDRDLQAHVSTGFYSVSVACVGDGSSIRVSLGDYNDTGRGLKCVAGSKPVSFTVGASNLAFHVAVDKAGPVVFRYTMSRVYP